MPVFKEGKMCTKCCGPGPFHKKKSSKDGLSTWCVLCKKAQDQAYRKANPEKIKEINHKYYEANSEKTKERVRVWAEANPERIKERDRNYYRENLERIKENQHKWQEANKEKKKETSRKWYKANLGKSKFLAKEWAKANPEKVNENSRRWYKANPEKAKASRRRWYRANPEKFRRYDRERRARKFNAPGSHTEAEWDALKAQYDHCCVKCGTSGSPKNPLTKDHTRPLSRGGSDFIFNIQPLCKRCNSGKRNRETISHRPDQTQLPLF